jgi:hypothetical protein
LIKRKDVYSTVSSTMLESSIYRIEKKKRKGIHLK